MELNIKNVVVGPSSTKKVLVPQMKVKKSILVKWRIDYDLHVSCYRYRILKNDSQSEDSIS